MFQCPHCEYHTPWHRNVRRHINAMHKDKNVTAPVAASTLPPDAATPPQVTAQPQQAPPAAPPVTSPALIPPVQRLLGQLERLVAWYTTERTLLIEGLDAIAKLEPETLERKAREEMASLAPLIKRGQDFQAKAKTKGVGVASADALFLQQITARNAQVADALQFALDLQARRARDTAALQVVEKIIGMSRSYQQKLSTLPTAFVKGSLQLRTLLESTMAAPAAPTDPSGLTHLTQAVGELHRILSEWKHTYASAHELVQDDADKLSSGQ